MPNIAKHYDVVDLLDPMQNLHGGAKYLRDMLILFNNDASLAVAAYNAGETAVIRHGNHIPPYRQTMDYVPRVLHSYWEYQENRPRQPDVLFINGIVHSPMSIKASTSHHGNSNGFAVHKNL